jgi:hypothetical protein
MGRLLTHGSLGYAWAVACVLATAEVHAGDLAPVQIESQQPPMVPNSQPQKLAPPVAKPLIRPASTPIVEAEAPPEPALEDFDIITADELSRGADEPSPKLADATKARMFNYRADDHCRAGYPEIVKHHFSMTSTNGRYFGYLVGGGSPFYGTGPSITEGTWGLDYQGFFNKRINLNWNRGRYYQGGIEGYKTDGPKHEKK